MKARCVQCRFQKPFAVGKFEVTVAQFQAFQKDTGYELGDECRIYEQSSRSIGYGYRSGRDWSNPGFSQSDESPVVCVSWDDAQAYIRWLNSKSDERYSLLSEAQWEYIARAGGAERILWWSRLFEFMRNCKWCGHQYQLW